MFILTKRYRPCEKAHYSALLSFFCLLRVHTYISNARTLVVRHIERKKSYRGELDILCTENESEKKSRDRIEDIPVPDMESGERPRNTPA